MYTFDEINKKFSSGDIFNLSDRELDELLKSIAMLGHQEHYSNRPIFFTQVINAIKSQRHIDKIETRNTYLTFLIIALTIINLYTSLK